MAKVQMPQNKKTATTIQHVKKCFYACNPQRVLVENICFHCLNMGPNSDALSSLKRHMTLHASSQAGGNNYDYIAILIYY